MFTHQSGKVKAQIGPVIKAHLIRGAFYLLLLSAGTLLAFFRPEARANVSDRTLTFAERVGYLKPVETAEHGTLAGTPREGD